MPSMSIVLPSIHPEYLLGVIFSFLLVGSVLMAFTTRFLKGGSGAAQAMAEGGWLGTESRASVFQRVVNRNCALVYRPNSVNKTLLSRCPSLSERGFKPTPWLVGHATTLLGNALRSQVPDEHVPFDHTQDVHLPDGGLVRLKWMRHKADPHLPSHAEQQQQQQQQQRPIFLIVPGTRGDSNSPYVRQMAYVAYHQGGFDVVVAPLRGCGVDELATPKCFDGCSYEDFKHVIKAIRTQGPGSSHGSHHGSAGVAPVDRSSTPMVAASFSMGAGMLAHHIAATGHECGISAAVAVSAAADYTRLVDGLQRSASGRFFQRVLLSVVKRKFRPHAKVFESVPGVSVEKALRAQSIPEWHEAVTCPLQGIASSRDFCERASFHHLLPNTKVPLLMINDENDPLCPASNISHEVAASSDNVILCRTKNGGHTAFLEGLWPFGGSPKAGGSCSRHTNITSAWDTRVIMEFLTACLEKTDAASAASAAATAVSAASTASACFARRPPAIDLEAVRSAAASPSPSGSPASSLSRQSARSRGSDRASVSSASPRGKGRGHSGGRNKPRSSA